MTFFSLRACDELHCCWCFTTLHLILVCSLDDAASIAFYSRLKCPVPVSIRSTTEHIDLSTVWVHKTGHISNVLGHCHHNGQIMCKKNEFLKSFPVAVCAPFLADANRVDS